MIWKDKRKITSKKNENFKNMETVKRKGKRLVEDLN